MGREGADLQLCRRLWCSESAQALQDGNSHVRLHSGLLLRKHCCCLSGSSNHSFGLHQDGLVCLRMGKVSTSGSERAADYRASLAAS